MLGLSWEPVGVSLGDLEPSWVELEVVVGGFWGTSIFMLLGSNFVTKSTQREAFWKPKRSKNLSWELLGAS